MASIGNLGVFGCVSSSSCFDYAINNAHIHVLYKHSCKRCDVRSKDLLAFRLELVHLLLDEVGLPKGVRQSSAGVGRAQSERVCYLEKVSKIGLKRGKCRHCQLKNRKPPRSSWMWSLQSEVVQDNLLCRIPPSLRTCAGLLSVTLLFCLCILICKITHMHTETLCTHTHHLCPS